MIEQQVKNRLMVLGLFLLFFLPILMAWYLVFFSKFNVGDGGYEHGMLVIPARQIDNFPLYDPANRTNGSLHGKWTLLMVVNGNCNHSCQQYLYNLRQIRFALGKELNRLQRVVFFTEIKNENDEAINISKDFPGQLILPGKNVGEDFLIKLKVDSINSTGAIHLIDPAGFYMMIYPGNTEPGGIIKDLKRLLRISKLD